MKKDFLTLQLPGEVSNSPSLDIIQGLHSGVWEEDSGIGI